MASNPPGGTVPRGGSWLHLLPPLRTIQKGLCSHSVCPGRAHTALSALYWLTGLAEVYTKPCVSRGQASLASDDPVVAAPPTSQQYNLAPHPYNGHHDNSVTRPSSRAARGIQRAKMGPGGKSAGGGMAGREPIRGWPAFPSSVLPWNPSPGLGAVVVTLSTSFLEQHFKSSKIRCLLVLILSVKPAPSPHTAAGCVMRAATVDKTAAVCWASDLHHSRSKSQFGPLQASRSPTCAAPFRGSSTCHLSRKKHKGSC